MKKIISVLLAVCLLVGTAACGGKQASTADPSGTSTAAESTPAGTTEAAVPEETYPLIAEQEDLDAVAAKTENFSFTKGEVAYYLAITFQNYYSYLSYFGVDPSVSLKEQTYAEDKTWFDIFMEEAMRYVENYLLFSEAAKDRGLSLDQNDLDYIASQKTQIEEDAAVYGWDPSTYLEQLFGTNISWEILEAAMQKMLLADKGYEAVIAELKATISEDVINNYYLGNRRDYDMIDYVDINFLDGSGLTDEVRAEITKAFTEAADEASFTKAVILYVDHTVEKEKLEDAGSSLQYAEELIDANTKHMALYEKSDMMDWAFDEDRTGTVFVDAEETDGARHAYLLKEEPYRDEETYVNVRHILIMTETLGSAEAARAKAEEIYAEWQAGDRSEDSFANMAIEHSEDGGSATDGGLYEEVYRGEMVKAFEDWCFDESRQPGDTGIVDTEYGSHIMYFVSSDVGWHMSVMDKLMDDLYGEFYEKLEQEHPITRYEEVLNAINW